MNMKNLEVKGKNTHSFSPYELDRYEHLPRIKICENCKYQLCDFVKMSSNRNFLQIFNKYLTIRTCKCILNKKQQVLLFWYKT